MCAAYLCVCMFIINMDIVSSIWVYTQVILFNGLSKKPSQVFNEKTFKSSYGPV